MRHITKANIARLKKEGFNIPDLSKLSEDDNLNGVIIQDGTFIQCNGYMEHIYIYPLLCRMNLVESGSWTEDRSAIHVSSNQLNGTVAYSIQNEGKDLVTQDQLNTLFALRKHILGVYGDRDKISKILFEYVCGKENFGGKYNGLAFLKRFYSNIQVPAFSKKQKDMDWSKPICLRTSPDHSLPGLLNSKFNVSQTDLKKHIKAINSDFAKFANVRKDNNLHYFFQEQIEGINGVCHVRGRDGKFSYSASNVRGDIVGGKQGSAKLTEKQVAELKSIAVELHKDFGASLQLEFVISESVNIVQLRVLQNEPEETVGLLRPKNAICFGETFSFGTIDVDTKDILIVESDGESNLLLGKKALIVTSNVEFSHLLALSKVLKIPSMYNTGNVKLPNGKVKFTAYNQTSWITRK